MLGHAVPTYSTRRRIPHSRFRYVSDVQARRTQPAGEILPNSLRA